jgi:hypothetical protein
MQDKRLIAVAVAVGLAVALGAAEVVERTGTLSISGRSGSAPVVRVAGKSYVEVEALAHLLNGSASYQTSRITLTLTQPASVSAPSTPVVAVQAAPAPAAPVVPPVPEPQARQGFSREFLRATIDEISVIREWRIAIIYAIQHSTPVTEDWVGAHRRSAESKLAMVSASMSTDADRNGYGLISNELGNMRALSDQYLKLQKTQTYVAPDSMGNDPLDQKIVGCAQALEGLSAGAAFQDIVACH